jgi:hypothetical protein
MIPTGRGWIGGYVREGDGALLRDLLSETHHCRGTAAPSEPEDGTARQEARPGPVESWARTAKPVIPIPFAVVLVLEPPKGALS